MKKILLSLAMVAFANSAIGQVVLLKEDFEGATFPPVGWDLTQTNATLFWDRLTPGRIGDGSAYIGFDFGKGLQDESLITPTFDLSTYTSATPVYLNFSVWLGYDYMVVPDDGTFKAEISENGGTWTTLWKEDEQGVYGNQSKILKSLDLSAYAGKSNLKVRFIFIGTETDIVVLDGVSISTFKENDLALTSRTDTSLTFGVTTLNSDSYSFQYGIAGFGLGQGTITPDFTDLSATITGLTPGVKYEYYIRSKTGSIYGAWEGPFVTNTPMYETPADLNYSYGFETDNLSIEGWFTENIIPQGENWYISADNEAIEGNKLAILVGSKTSDSNSWLFSRPITLIKDTEVEINYSVRKYNIAGSNGSGDLRVTIGTEATAVGQTTDLSASASVTNTAFEKVTKKYKVLANGTYYIGFQGTFATQDDTNWSLMFLDDISVKDPALSTNDFISSKFSVSPNPANDVVTIANADNMFVNNVTVTDLNGRTVKNVSFDNVATAQVNVADLASGLYIMNVTSDKGTATKKFVKN